MNRGDVEMKLEYLDRLLRLSRESDDCRFKSRINAVCDSIESELGLGETAKSEGTSVGGLKVKVSVDAEVVQEVLQQIADAAESHGKLISESMEKIAATVEVE